MSQLPPPPPFTPPGPLGYQPPYPDPLTPAKRVAVLMWVLGALGVLGCGCLGTLVWVLPMDQFVTQMQARMTPAQLAQLKGINLARVMQIASTVICAVGIVVGVTMIVLAFFVRRGSRGAIITTIILAGFLGAWCVLSVLGNGFAAVSGSPQALAAVLVWIVISGVVALLISMLVQALRASRNRLTARGPADTYWQMQQLQSELGGPPGYGYAPPPPPPPPGDKPIDLPPPPPPA